MQSRMHVKDPSAELTAQGVVEVVVPELAPVLKFYQSLGFTIERQTGMFVVLRWQSTLLFVAQDDAATTTPRWANVRLVVPDVDAMWERANALRLPIVSAIGDREYGLRDFTVRDPAGFEVRFAQVLSR